MASALAQKYAPDIYMDVKEPYWPCTYGDYIRNSRVITADGKVVLDPITDPNDIAKYDGGYRLDLRRDARAGMIDARRYPSKLEIYCMEKRLTYGDVGKDPSYDVTDVYYIMLNAYNGTLESHDSDREFVMIRFQGQTPDGVYFSHHSGGFWRHWDDVSKTPDGRPKVYSAIESHAFFDKPGTYRRVLGFGKDSIDPVKEPLSYGKSYDLVMAGPQADLEKRPYMASRIGRTSVDGSTFFYDWVFERPQKRATPTDFASLFKNMFGGKVTVAAAVCVATIAAILYHAIRRGNYATVLAVPLSVVLGLLWFVEAAPYQISNTVNNLTI